MYIATLDLSSRLGVVEQMCAEELVGAVRAVGVRPGQWRLVQFLFSGRYALVLSLPDDGAAVELMVWLTAEGPEQELVSSWSIAECKEVGNLEV